MMVGTKFCSNDNRLSVPYLAYGTMSPQLAGSSELSIGLLTRTRRPIARSPQNPCHLDGK
jgi:hypothetical protein